MRNSGPRSAGFRGNLVRGAFRVIGSVPSQKSLELQSLESLNARIVFGIAGNNLSLVQSLLPHVSTPKANEFIEQSQLFLGMMRDLDTYLHLAARGNKPAIFQLLLDQGFGKDLETRNKANLKPGQYASPAINRMILKYQSQQAGKLGQGQGVFIAAKLAASPSSGQPPAPPTK